MTPRGSYEENGFVAMVRLANPTFDVIAVDAHFGYYMDEILVERLHQDVIAPLRAKYDQVWIAGISLGGFGASAYTLEHEEDVDGLILLAPYMGKRAIYEEVRAAGGLASWQPPTNWREIGDNETRKYYEVWNWLRGYGDPAAARPKLFLAYGAEDDFRVPNDLLGRELPTDRVEVRPGGHNWTVWRPAFGKLLSRSIRDSAIAAR